MDRNNAESWMLINLDQAAVGGFLFLFFFTVGRTGCRGYGYVCTGPGSGRKETQDLTFHW
jgi:hypothetical protein